MGQVLISKGVNFLKELKYVHSNLMNDISMNLNVHHTYERNEWGSYFKKI